jgi:Rrf2 family protein
MRITNKGEYGLRIAMRLARNYPTGEPMTTHEIAGIERISEDYVQKLLWQLLQAGIIESRRGAKGGFILARSPKEITARHIVWALEGGIFEVACLRFMEGEKRCMYLDLHDCGLRGLWVNIYQKVNELLTEASLELLIQEEDRVKERLRSVSTRRVIPITAAGAVS